MARGAKSRDFAHWAPPPPLTESHPAQKLLAEMGVPPHSGRKSRFLAPQDIPDISGYQLGIGCQFVKANNNKNHATNQKIF